MNSRTAERFWKCYSELPATIKKHAKEAYKQFQEDPYYQSLHFKQVHSTRPIFSVRIKKTIEPLALFKVRYHLVLDRQTFGIR